jgi:hypothetical protein
MYATAGCGIRLRDKRVCCTTGCAYRWLRHNRVCLQPGALTTRCAHNWVRAQAGAVTAGCNHKWVGTTGATKLIALTNWCHHNWVRVTIGCDHESAVTMYKAASISSAPLHPRIFFRFITTDPLNIYSRVIKTFRIRIPHFL